MSLGTNLGGTLNIYEQAAGTSGTRYGVEARIDSVVAAPSTQALIGLRAQALHHTVSTFGINGLTAVNALVANGDTTTVINVKGVDIVFGTNAGTVTNTYGVYVGDVTNGTQTNTPYSFYASDPNAYNYFAGNIGIGTINPSEKLAVNGNITATAYFNNSDRRLKEQIEALDDDGIAIIRQLRGVSFLWKEGGRKAFGLIAQEVEAVAPHAVIIGGDGMKSVDYIMMVGPMIEAIKYLDREARARDARFVAMESRMTALEELVHTLMRENEPLRTGATVH